MIKHVLFDLDGTLLDTREGILESAAHAASALGYPALPRETLLQFVGPPIQQSFMTHYGCDAAAAQRAANLFRDYYKDRALLKAEPYPGIYRLCDTLRDRGIDMAVATYKREDYALTLLEHFGFDRYCAVMHGADNENRLKKEDIVEMCLRELGASRTDSVLVGDTVHDALGAQRAGLPFIAVTYGFGFKAPEDVRDHPHIGVAGTPMEIEDIVSGGRA